jgi:hypothetical protein
MHIINNSEIKKYTIIKHKLLKTNIHKDIIYNHILTKIPYSSIEYKIILHDNNSILKKEIFEEYTKQIKFYIGDDNYKKSFNFYTNYINHPNKLYKVKKNKLINESLNCAVYMYFIVDYDEKINKDFKKKFAF